MKIEPAEPRLGRYWVESESGETPYLVDIDAYWGNGWCNCKDFQTDKEKELSALLPSERNWTDQRYRCKHIRAARVFEGLQLVDARQRATKILCDPEGW